MDVNQIIGFLHEPLNKKILQIENNILKLQMEKINLVNESSQLLSIENGVRVINKECSYIDFYDFVKKIKYDNSNFSINVYRKPNGQIIEYYRVNKSHIDSLMSEVTHYSEFVFIYNKQPSGLQL